MDQPPAQDSTKHILNVLNDDCIEAIFRRILRLEDFLNMAEVCQRFQQNAKNCFRMQFKWAFLTQHENNDQRYNIIYRHRIPTERAIPFLKTFGPFIHTLKWWSISSESNDHNDDIFKSIVKFTSKTLKELYIHYKYNLDFAQTQFSALEVLRLCDTIPENFEQFPSLKGLSYYESTDCNFLNIFTRTNPPLEWLFLSSEFVTDDIISRFLSLNPQLQNLTLTGSNKLTPMILISIGNNAINLTKLKLSTFRLRLNRKPDLLHANLQYLGALRRLKYIEIELSCTAMFETMINIFAVNEVPIETMRILLTNKNNINRSYQLLTIKTLKYINFLEFPRKNCFNKLMVNILETQTALESIWMFLRDVEDPVPMLEIQNVLRYGLRYCKKLSIFECQLRSLEVNLESYDLVLSMVENRILTKILICRPSSCNCIPDDVLEKNSEKHKWLDVRYVRVSDKGVYNYWSY